MPQLVEDGGNVEKQMYSEGAEVRIKLYTRLTDLYSRCLGELVIEGIIRKMKQLGLIKVASFVQL